MQDKLYGHLENCDVFQKFSFFSRNFISKVPKFYLNSHKHSLLKTKFSILGTCSSLKQAT